MGKIYNTRTSSLSATEANIRKTKTKKLVINDIPFAKVIDERGNSITENDLWINGVTADENGVVTVTQGGKIDVSDWTIDSTTKNSITKVENNKAYNGDTFVCNIQTDAIENAESMFFYNIALASFDSDLSSLTDGVSMFRHCINLTTFDSDLSSLTNGNSMFYKTKLASFTSDLPSLTNGNHMFYLSALASFNINLPELTDGSHMFYQTDITSFTSDLPSLTNGDWMFYGTNLASFTSDLPELTNGNHMFSYCTNLKSFYSDLSSLTYGNRTFYKSALASFNSDLSSLIDGSGMFYSTKLNPQSVFIISDTIRDITTEKASLTSSDYVTRTGSGTTADPYIYSKPFGWMSNGNYVYSHHKTDYNDTAQYYYTQHIASYDVGNLTIGVGVTDESQLDEFAKAAYHDSWLDLKQTFSDKGWTVRWQYGGTYNDITLNELDGQTTSLPIWAKLSEATEKNGNYCTEDGSKYYNISWGHDVNEEAKDSTNTDTSKFFLFGSLLEAMGYFGVIPKEYVEKNSDSSEQQDENTSN